MDSVRHKMSSDLTTIRLDRGPSSHYILRRTSNAPILLPNDRNLHQLPLQSFRAPSKYSIEHDALLTRLTNLAGTEMVSRKLRHGYQRLRSPLPYTSDLLHHVAAGTTGHTSNDELESGNAGRDFDHSHGLLHH
jgi:hypothetical protein